jgi:hypothetical protein
MNGSKKQIDASGLAAIQKTPRVLVTPFVVMQFTARIDWEKQFSNKTCPPNPFPL